MQNALLITELFLYLLHFLSQIREYGPHLFLLLFTTSLQYEAYSKEYTTEAQRKYFLK